MRRVESIYALSAFSLIDDCTVPVSAHTKGVFEKMGNFLVSVDDTERIF